jgi:hypothetical protein
VFTGNIREVEEQSTQRIIGFLVNWEFQTKIGLEDGGCARG